MRVWKAAFAYFACVMGAGALLGSIRVPWVVPRIGVRAAELLEMPLMLVVIVIAARWSATRFGLRAETRACAAVGAIALALAVATELLLALELQHMTPAQFLSSRDPVSGTVYLLVLVLFGLMPVLLSRIDALKALILEH